jgi:ABC-type spermidine/putrescine transport system permease subunit I
LRSRASVSKYSTYLMLLPGLVLCFLFLIIPFGIIVAISLSENISAATMILSGLTLENYANFFAKTSSYIILANTFGNSGLTCGICLVVGYPFAYLLSFYVKNEKIKSYVISLLIVPFLIDMSIRMIAWIPILGEGGIVNSLLASLGIMQAPAMMLFNVRALQILWLQSYVLFMVFPIYLALNRVDPDLIDAARVLRAPPQRVFFDVTFRLSLPGVVCGCMFVFVSTLGDYVTPLFIGGGIQTLGLSVSDYSSSFLWPYAAALSTILVAVAIAVLYVLLKVVNIKELVYER